MQLFCQWTLLALSALGLLMAIYSDFNGRKAKAPGGFKGFIVTAIVTAAVFAANVCAGTFSLIFN